MGLHFFQGIEREFSKSPLQRHSDFALVTNSTVLTSKYKNCNLYKKLHTAIIILYHNS